MYHMSYGGIFQLYFTHYVLLSHSDDINVHKTNGFFSSVSRKLLKSFNF